MTPRGHDGTIAGVVLAAGTSSRFGEGNKLLATVAGTPLVRHATESMLASRVESITVVLGHESERVRNVLSHLDVCFVENPDYREGQATSVRRAVQVIRDRADAVVFALGDMPAVDSASIDALIEAYEAGRGGALAAAYEGERGNPVLFDERYFDALAEIDGDVGGREILRQEGVLVETDDPGVRRDVDVPDDLDTVSSDVLE